MHSLYVVSDDQQDNNNLLQAFNASLPRLVIQQFATRNEVIEKVQSLSPEAFPSLVIFSATADSPGADFVCSLKQEKIYRRIPIVAISTYLPAEQLKLLYQEGINCFVPKPLERGGWDQLAEWMYLLFLRNNSI